jgi:hypothetical protein
MSINLYFMLIKFVTGSLYVIVLVAFLGMKARIIYRKNLTTEGADWMAKILRNPGSRSASSEGEEVC